MIDFCYRGPRVVCRAPDALVTVANVPMVSTGIDYPTSQGLITLTEQHLQDLVASQDDPAIHPPRTKIGHSDPRFNGQVTPSGDVLDGEPSLGTWVNLRLGDNNQTVFGDLIGVPRWFANIMATAYPSRSVEGNFDVETVTGKKWSLSVDAVALLGVIGPGITTLEDLPILYTAAGPDDIKIIEAEEGQPMSVLRSKKGIRAQVNMDDVRREYYESLGPEQFWWWIRAIYVDPDELIIDDDEGGLYRVPFSTSGEEVSFGEPVPVKIQYVDQPKAAASASLRAALATALGSDRVAATYTVRAESRPTGGSMTREQIEALRRRLNLTPEQLPDDADDATVLQVLNETGEPSPGETPPAPPPAPNPNPERPGAPNPTETEPPAPEPPHIPEGYSLVDEATLNELREGARQGVAVASRLANQDRDAFIDGAIKAGKFPPARKKHYLDAWAADPEGTRGLVESLAPGLVPVEARGTAGGSGSQRDDGYEMSWLSPSERSRIKAAAGGDGGSTENPRVIQGGD